MTNKLNSALTLAKEGFFIHPLRDNDKAARVKDWEGEATVDPARIREWWSRWPQANIGIATGKSGIIVIDIDPDEGGDIKLLPLSEQDRQTVIQDTGRGGNHLLYRQPQGVQFGNGNTMPKGCDSRGHGGYIVGPGSVHPETGTVYAWQPGAGPGEREILPLPFALGQLLKEKGEPPSEPPPTVILPKNGNNSAYAEAALASELSALATKTEGDRNTYLNKAAFSLGQFVAAGELAQSEVETALTDIALSIGLSEAETPKTITSALSAGMEQPRQIPAAYPDRAPDAGQTVSKNGKKSEPKREKKRVPTDDELRDRFLSTTGSDTIFGLGEFRRYQSGIWQKTPAMVVENEISNVVEEAKKEGVKPSMRLLNSVSGLTKRRAFVADEIFNSDPDYLVCANGTLYIPEMNLMEHTKKLYATSGVDYDYNPNAQCPSWQTFCISLARSTSPEVVNFLQEFAGYALTTDMKYETAIWLYGSPGAGRSTFLLGLETMLNERAGVLGLAEIERSRFALSHLTGKTLLVASEQPNLFMKSTNLLNNIISGDKISIDRKFLPVLEIYPRAKIAWAMNELPRVGDPNSGIFRRVKVVEFPVIPPGRRDPGLKGEIKREGSGILNWALAGLARLNERGRFDVPKDVSDATQNFQANNDIPARFVEECCLTGPDYKTQGSLLYNAYKEWAIETGHKPQSSTSIANDWKRLEFKKYLAAGKSFWRNVGLKSAI